MPMDSGVQCSLRNAGSGPLLEDSGVAPAQAKDSSLMDQVLSRPAAQVDSIDGCSAVAVLGPAALFPLSSTPALFPPPNGKPEGEPKNAVGVQGSLVGSLFMCLQCD